MKLELKDIVMIVSLITSSLVAVLWIQSEFASAGDFKSFKEYTVKEFVDVRIERIVLQLNSITAKEKEGFATRYDAIRKEELEREWELLKEQKKNAN